MQSKHSMASATAIPSRHSPDSRGVAEIYIGGAADGQSRIVASFAQARQRAIMSSHERRDRTADWFAHYDIDAAAAHCQTALTTGRELALIGHSWGSDAALRVAHQLNGPVALLAGVDPVMRPGSAFSRVSHRPGNTVLVVHVDARPRRMDRSDLVKATGVMLGGGVAQAYRRADVTIRAELNHWAFADMMAAPGRDGVSLNDHIRNTGRPRPTSQTG